jgi:hypothetical protein
MWFLFEHTVAAGSHGRQGHPGLGTLHWSWMLKEVGSGIPARVKINMFEVRTQTCKTVGTFILSEKRPNQEGSD